MTTTSPDAIPAPDLPGPYAPIQAFNNLATATQTALNRRANTYKGTSSERLAFTTGQTGVLWKDTDGAKKLWAWSGTVWELVVPDPPARVRVASGSETLPSVPANTTISHSVTLPPGVFTGSPRVILQNVSAPSAARNMMLRPTGLSASGFTISAHNFDTNAYNAVVYWIAVQEG